MNLIELYDSLSSPDSIDEKTFNATPIPEFPNFRIAIDVNGYPVLLLSVANAVKNIALKNFRLKYLQLEQNIACKVSENERIDFQNFTVITFTSADRNLQEYFLRISETLVRTINNRPTQQQIIESLNKFVEVFRALTDTPTNTVHGLWTELFLIDNSIDAKTVLNYWHSIPEEKFDFNSGAEKIEVKSNSNFERIHTFSSEQLNPPVGTQVLVASIFIRQNNSGQSIQQIADSITTKTQNDVDLSEKLHNIIIKTLGNSLEQSIRIKFDFNLAKESLQFYRQQDISKIEEIHIPNEVSDIKYKSDLSNLVPVKRNELADKGQLFSKM